MGSDESSQSEILQIDVVSEATLALSEGDLRPYQVVALLGQRGQKVYEYSRYLAAGDTGWVRHGVFQAFHRNGKLASQGLFQHGVEDGAWQDFHENGQLAAEGLYAQGKEVGKRQYWSDTGAPQQARTMEPSATDCDRPS